MPFFSRQPMNCCICGIAHQSDFKCYGGVVCSQECQCELAWRKLLSMLGEEYRPDPKRQPQGEKVETCLEP